MLLNIQMRWQMKLFIGFPETGVADLRIGSQVIVRESQRAIFFRDGQALDVFGPGRHTIITANIPKLVDLIGKAFNDRTPFTAEVYYVSMQGICRSKMGNTATYYCSQSRHGYWCGIIARIWLL